MKKSTLISVLYFMQGDLYNGRKQLEKQIVYNIKLHLAFFGKYHLSILDFIYIYVYNRT